AYVYAQGHNLYLVEMLADNKEADPVQLTTDGEDDYSFGFRRGQSNQNDDEENGQDEGQDDGQKTRANVTWSKDSKRFYVSRSDSRKVKELYLVNSLSEPRPTLLSYKYSMPGEPDVTQQELFCFTMATKKLQKMPIEKYKDQR